MLVVIACMVVVQCRTQSLPGFVCSVDEIKSIYPGPIDNTKIALISVQQHRFHDLQITDAGRSTTMIVIA
jgi:hypothetical protein